MFWLDLMHAIVLLQLAILSNVCYMKWATQLPLLTHVILRLQKR